LRTDPPRPLADLGRRCCIGVPLVRLDSVAEVRLGRQRSPKDHPELTCVRTCEQRTSAGPAFTGRHEDDELHRRGEMSIYGLCPGDLLLNSPWQRSSWKPAIGKARWRIAPSCGTRSYGAPAGSKTERVPGSTLLQGPGRRWSVRGAVARLAFITLGNRLAVMVTPCRRSRSSGDWRELDQADRLRKSHAPAALALLDSGWRRRPRHVRRSEP